MFYQVCYLFLFFLVYSIIGYFVEICFCSYHAKKLVLNRGFLIGPYLPIYGISVVLMSYLLQKYEKDPIALFVMACIVCSLVEYFTSLILEKIFKVRWWDYSHIRFNIDGRICLSNSMMFGFGSLVLFYLVHPFILSCFQLLNPIVIIILSSSLFCLFFIDLVLSVTILTKLKISSRSFASKDVSEEITRLRNERLRKNSFLFTRLLNAFPKISGKNMDHYIEMKKKTNEFRKTRKEENAKYKKVKKKKEV